jgi:hypothetical protein
MGLAVMSWVRPEARWAGPCLFALQTVVFTDPFAVSWR